MQLSITIEKFTFFDLIAFTQVAQLDEKKNKHSELQA